MKTSNKLLIALVAALIAVTVFIDVLLKRAYSNINLSDPFKSYQSVAIRPFKYLKITGGNGYAIEIKQAAIRDFKVMNTRKNFLSTLQNGDTLFVKFTVPNATSMRDPESLPLGIIISSPEIAGLIVNGTNNILTGVKADSLGISLMGNATVNVNHADIGKLNVSGKQSAMVNFNKANKVKQLDLQQADNAVTILGGIHYSVLKPRLTGKSQLIFGAQAASKL